MPSILKSQPGLCALIKLQSVHTCLLQSPILQSLSEDEVGAEHLVHLLVCVHKHAEYDRESFLKVPHHSNLDDRDLQDKQIFCPVQSIEDVRELLVFPVPQLQ